MYWNAKKIKFPVVVFVAERFKQQTVLLNLFMRYKWALGKTWNGMEWNGMEWNGLEWNGMD